MTKKEENVLNSMDKRKEKEIDDIWKKKTIITSHYMIIITHKIELITGNVPDFDLVYNCLEQASGELLSDKEFLKRYEGDKVPSNQLLVVNRVINRAMELYFGDTWG